MNHPPRVFISYSWDSEAHKERVLDLANRLRAMGIDCQLDQYEVSPPQGWARWMRERIEQSDYVLVVCTETYQRRATGKEEAGKGLGVTWEGALTEIESQPLGGVGRRALNKLESGIHSVVVAVGVRNSFRGCRWSPEFIPFGTRNKFRTPTATDTE